MKSFLVVIVRLAFDFVAQIIAEQNETLNFIQILNGWLVAIYLTNKNLTKRALSFSTKPCWSLSSVHFFPLYLSSPDVNFCLDSFEGPLYIRSVFSSLSWFFRNNSACRLYINNHYRKIATTTRRVRFGDEKNTPISKLFDSYYANNAYHARLVA